MKIVISDDIYLSEITREDKSAYLEHFSEEEVSKRLLVVPYPYTEPDANHWIEETEKLTQTQGQPTRFAIRKKDGDLIGGFGFKDFQLGKDTRAEIGYWLAKPHWNQGIMSSVVERMAKYGFEEFKLTSITACIFHDNDKSARVLEKNGFHFEKIIEKGYIKDGQAFDAKLYIRSLNANQF